MTTEPQNTPGPAPGWLTPIPTVAKSGVEPFRGVQANVADFWSWAFSDLRENTTRGILAEFLVAHAVGAVGRIRKSWDNYDLLSPSGVRIEVKASGYLQSWPQAKVSTITFGKLTGLTWDENTGVQGEQREVRADVFVFAVQTCTEHDTYDALDVAQWEFYVLSAAAIRDAGTRTAGIAFVRSHASAGPIAWAELADAIEAAAESSLQPARTSRQRAPGGGSVR